MHLAERGGGRGLEVEIGKTLAPVRPELGLHAPAHERRPHWRGLRLELRQFGGEIRRHRIGDGRQHLRDLHQRALHRAQGGSERLGVRLAPAAAQPIDADPGGERACVDAEARIAGRPRAQAIGFVVMVQTRDSRVVAWQGMEYRSRADQFQPPAGNRGKMAIFPKSRVTVPLCNSLAPCPPRERRRGTEGMMILRFWRGWTTPAPSFGAAKTS